MEDYNIRWRYKNRFAFLGNGDVKATAARDVKGLSTYMRNSGEWETPVIALLFRTDVTLDHEWNVD